MTPYYGRSRLLLCFCLLVACSPTLDLAPRPQWNVEPNLYSGRTNPQGRLPPDKAQQLEETLSALTGGAVQKMGGLGYQGFTVRRQGAAGANDILHITVYNGIVEVTRTSGVQYLTDPDRTLEKWLFEAANGWLSGDERRLIGEDLGGS